jgi:hypothetical protein
LYTLHTGPVFLFQQSIQKTRWENSITKKSR